MLSLLVEIGFRFARFSIRHAGWYGEQSPVGGVFARVAEAAGIGEAIERAAGNLPLVEVSFVCYIVCICTNGF